MIFFSKTYDSLIFLMRDCYPRRLELFLDLCTEIWLMCIFYVFMQVVPQWAKHVVLTFAKQLVSHVICTYVLLNIGSMIWCAIDVYYRIATSIYCNLIIQAKKKQIPDGIEHRSFGYDETSLSTELFVTYHTCQFE